MNFTNLPDHIKVKIAQMLPLKARLQLRKCSKRENEICQMCDTHLKEIYVNSKKFYYTSEPQNFRKKIRFWRGTYEDRWKTDVFKKILKVHGERLHVERLKLENMGTTCAPTINFFKQLDFRKIKHIVILALTTQDLIVSLDIIGDHECEFFFVSEGRLENSFSMNNQLLKIYQTKWLTLVRSTLNDSEFTRFTNLRILNLASDNITISSIFHFINGWLNNKNREYYYFGILLAQYPNRERINLTALRNKFANHTVWIKNNSNIIYIAKNEQEIAEIKISPQVMEHVLVFFKVNSSFKTAPTREDGFETSPLENIIRKCLYIAPSLDI